MFNHPGIYPALYIYLDRALDPPNVQHKVMQMIPEGTLSPDICEKKRILNKQVLYYNC